MEKKRFENYCTVKQLEEFIKEHNLSGTDTIIVMQRVEDFYFDKKSWKEGLVRKKGEQYHSLLRWNSKIGDPELPGMTEDMRISEEFLEKTLCEYYPCWCPVFYDNEFLYLDAHY